MKMLSLDLSCLALGIDYYCHLATGPKIREHKKNHPRLQSLWTERCFNLVIIKDSASHHKLD